MSNVDTRHDTICNAQFGRARYVSKVIPVYCMRGFELPSVLDRCGSRLGPPASGRAYAVREAVVSLPAGLQRSTA